MRGDRQITAACDSTIICQRKRFLAGAFPSLGILQSQEGYHYIFINSNKTWQAWSGESDLPQPDRQSASLCCKKSTERGKKGEKKPRNAQKNTDKCQYIESDAAPVKTCSKYKKSTRSYHREDDTKRY